MQQRDKVQVHYTKYIEEGGDGERVLKDRAASLNYDDAFLQSCGLDPKTAAPLFVASCGSGCPLRLPGQPRTGETVIDLGCGAGHDMVLASRIVGKTGKVIGVDMTDEMLIAAKKNMQLYAGSQHGEQAKNVVFIKAAFDDAAESESQLEENCADVVISNGVFNLCVDKRQAFATAFRALKPGGRFLLSDVCKVEDNPSAVLGCSVGDSWSS